MKITRLIESLIHDENDLIKGRRFRGLCKDYRRKKREEEREENEEEGEEGNPEG